MRGAGKVAVISKVRIAATVSSLLLMLAVLAHTYNLGYQSAANRGAAQLAQLQASHAEALSVATNNQRDIERALQQEVDAVQARAQLVEEEAAREQERYQGLIADLRAGTGQLSIAVRNCEASAATAATRATAASDGWTGGTTTRAELDPEAAAALVAIARDGDRNTRERNACVAAYEAVRTRLNNELK